MKRSVVASVGLLASGVALADNVEGADRLLCAPVQIKICVEEAECYPAHASELGVPDFVIVDLKNKKMQTTKSSRTNQVHRLFEREPQRRPDLLAGRRERPSVQLRDQRAYRQPDRSRVARWRCRGRVRRLHEREGRITAARRSAPATTGPG